MPIPRTPVVSSQVVSIGYDATTKELDVEFKPFTSKKHAADPKPNPVYRYRNITPEIFASIIGAESIGKAVNATLKKFPDRYPYKKLSEEELAQ